MDNINVSVNLHINSMGDFRVETFEGFVVVKLTSGCDGVTVFLTRSNIARAIAELFTAAAVALDEKRLAVPAEVK